MAHLSKAIDEVRATDLKSRNNIKNRQIKLALESSHLLAVSNQLKNMKENQHERLISFVTKKNKVGLKILTDIF